MKINTIEQVVSRGAGDTTPSITGEVVGVWPPKTGSKPGKNGKPFQWSRQMVLMADGDNKIAAIIWNHPALTEESKGRKLTIVCDEAMKIKEYNDNLQLEVPREAKLQWEGEVSEVPTASRTAGGVSTPPPANQNASQGHRVSKFTVSDVRKRIGKHANALKLAVDAACHVADYAHVKKVEFSPSDIKEIAVHICIGLEKGFYVDALPSGEMKAAAPEPEADEDEFSKMCPADEEPASSLFDDEG